MQGQKRRVAAQIAGSGKLSSDHNPDHNDIRLPAAISDLEERIMRGQQRYATTCPLFASRRSRRVGWCVIAAFLAACRPLRLLDSGRGHDLHAVGVPPVIHFSTASLVHIYAVVDQHVYLNHPQAYTQGASLGRPGDGLIGACSHAGPGSLACGQSIVMVQR